MMMQVEEDCSFTDKDNDYNTLGLHITQSDSFGFEIVEAIHYDF
jgi:hypothetical protein